ncbi:uncharacterized protein [Gossypium hirsutum]|uniref:Uncharacterized protein n=1 Tax=Gossypium hirsutum TaxID=3635 RepID=A0ABM3ARG7_GOSHI|nr:uncharacterized protein LOC121221074 [Gossypium hirsutum]
MQYPFPFPIPISHSTVHSSHFPFPSPLFHRSLLPFPFPFPFPIPIPIINNTNSSSSNNRNSSKGVFSLLLKNWFILCRKSHYGAGGGYNHFAGSYTQLMLLSPVSLRLSSAVEFPHCAGSLGIQRLSQSTPVQSS